MVSIMGKENMGKGEVGNWQRRYKIRKIPKMWTPLEIRYALIPKNHKLDKPIPLKLGLIYTFDGSGFNLSPSINLA